MALTWLGPMPFPALQALFDLLFFPRACNGYWKGDFIKELPDWAIYLHIEYMRKVPTALSIAHIYPIDGAVCFAQDDTTILRTAAMRHGP